MSTDRIAVSYKIATEGTSVNPTPTIILDFRNKSLKGVLTRKYPEDYEIDFILDTDAATASIIFSDETKVIQFFANQETLDYINFHVNLILQTSK